MFFPKFLRVTLILHQISLHNSQLQCKKAAPRKIQPFILMGAWLQTPHSQHAAKRDTKVICGGM